MASTTANEIERKLRQGLTVADLIAELEGMNPDAKVVFVCDYGDYTHTQQALPVETIEATGAAAYCLTTSAYSRSGLALAEMEEDGEANPDCTDIVVLR
jgi:hypothetical protein